MDGKTKGQRQHKGHVKITYHGEKRARERLGIPRSAVRENTEKAIRYGVTVSETYGPFRNYLEHLYLTYGTANNIRAYNHFVYVFVDNVLITILNVPTKYVDVSEICQRRKYNLMTEGESHYVKSRKRCVPK